MPKRSSKKPTKKLRQAHTQQLATKLLDAVVPEAEAKPEKPAKNPAAVALGRLGGLKGGKARAANLSAGQRSEIAKKAALARWVRPQ